jgi:uncharacterized membrane protein HdeD (DUF308 family)
LIDTPQEDTMSVAPTAAPESPSVADRLSGVGRSPVLIVSEGVLGALLGILVLTWPGPTVVVLAWTFGALLIVTGVLHFVAAFSDQAGAAGRVLSCLLGTLLLLAGLLCLRSPLQTALVLGLLIGVVWVVGGVVRIAQGFVLGRGAARWWRIAAGVLLVGAGALVLEFPGASLVTLASILGIVLLLEGICLVAVGLTTHRSPAAAPPATAEPPNRLTTVPPVPPSAAV